MKKVENSHQLNRNQLLLLFLFNKYPVNCKFGKTFEICQSFGMNRNVQNQKFLPTFIKPASQMKLLHFSDSARNSSVYFLLSFIFLLTGEFFYIITLFKSCKRIFVFLSGISFVLGGNNYKTRKSY